MEGTYMTTKFNRAVLTLCLMLVLLASTAFAADQAVWRDATGHDVPTGLDAQRVVSLAPNLTEIAYFLGLGSRMAGRTDFCNYPAAAAKLPTVGGFADTSLEKIVSLKPDLVLAYQGNSLELVEQLRALGIPVAGLSEANTLAEVAQTMREVSCVVCRPGSTSATAAANVIQQWEADVAALTVKPGQSAPTVFFGYPGELSMTAAPGTFLNDVITRAGGRNIVPASEERWPMVSAEFVVGANPAFILTATSCTEAQDAAQVRAKLLAELKRDAVWSKLAAVKQEHVIVLESDVLLRPGPRLLEALRQLNAALKRGAQA
jgi:iron complex transport system substrate-binding protein